jgi:putative intracellular protease/amidase
MRNRKTPLLVLTFLLVLVSSQGIHQPGRVSVQNSSKVFESRQTGLNALVLISENFGWNSHDVIEDLQSMGVTVTIITASTYLDDIPSCTNHPEQRPLDADILLSTFDLNTIGNYDIVFCPAGPNWAFLDGQPSVQALLQTGYSSGLVVATLCIGDQVVIAADIGEGCKVASYDQCNVLWELNNATPVAGMLAVSDTNLVTGGGGGGIYGGGHTVAPTYETVSMAVKTAAGRSFVDSCTIETDSAGSVFSISVTTQDPAAGMTGITSTTIVNVGAVIYPLGEIEAAQTVPLTSVGGGTYNGSLSGLTAGEFSVAIEVTDSAETLEVVRNASSISIAAGFIFPPELIPVLLIGGIGAIAIIAVVIILRRRK